MHTHFKDKSILVTGAGREAGTSAADAIAANNVRVEANVTAWPSFLATPFLRSLDSYVPIRGGLGAKDPFGCTASERLADGCADDDLAGGWRGPNWPSK